MTPPPAPPAAAVALMPRSLVLAFSVTDGLFLLYWTASALAQFGVAPIPRELMYAHYDQPQVIAWNWSFLPIDLAFSTLGLAAVAASRRRSRLWAPLALLSLAFTLAAGAMAVGYWTLLGEFEPNWFLPNLALMLWPVIFLPGLVLRTAAA